ncbi:hypothetical protein [Neobacillus sp. FSL H8-0543]|uniref:hypothetical protein n=1 Tax=Neobacillus sp. FSL H8-0543 TaxID=2954672 RepID=UPI003158C653
MQKAIMLAENINGFIKFVHNKKTVSLNSDKLYQVKLIMEDFKFQILADELLRINQFDWDEKYTLLLVDRFISGMNIIEEYVKNNYNDLFILSARIHTLKSLSLSLSQKKSIDLSI